MKKIKLLCIIIGLNFSFGYSQNTYLGTGNVGIGATTQTYKLSLGGSSNKIGMGSATSQIQVLYLPDQSTIPGSIAVGGYDISPGALQGLRDGYLTVVVDQQFYESAFMAVVQAVLEKKFKLKNIVANTMNSVITNQAQSQKFDPLS